MLQCRLLLLKFRQMEPLCEIKLLNLVLIDMFNVCTVALMCTKDPVIIFDSFLYFRENLERPRLIWRTL